MGIASGRKVILRNPFFLGATFMKHVRRHIMKAYSQLRSYDQWEVKFSQQPSMEEELTQPASAGSILALAGSESVFRDWKVVGN